MTDSLQFLKAARSNMTPVEKVLESSAANVGFRNLSVALNNLQSAEALDATRRFLREAETRVLNETVVEGVALAIKTKQAQSPVQLPRLFRLLKDYPKTFRALKESITEAIERNIDLADAHHPGRKLKHDHITGPDNSKKKRAIRGFIDQVCALTDAPMLLAEVVTPQQIGRAVRVIAKKPDKPLYAYRATKFFAVVDKQSSYREEAQIAVADAMAKQVKSGRPDRVVALAGDLAIHFPWMLEKVSPATVRQAGELLLAQSSAVAGMESLEFADLLRAFRSHPQALSEITENMKVKALFDLQALTKAADAGKLPEECYRENVGGAARYAIGELLQMMEGSVNGIVLTARRTMGSMQLSRYAA